MSGATARAQTAVTPGRAIPVHFTATAVPADPHPGEVVTVTVTAKIDAGWHLYAPASAAPTNTPATVSDIAAAYDWEPARADTGRHDTGNEVRPELSRRVSPTMREARSCRARFELRY